MVAKQHISDSRTFRSGGHAAMAHRYPPARFPESPAVSTRTRNRQRVKSRLFRAMNQVNVIGRKA
jgi:hypothetical protein